MNTVFQLPNDAGRSRQGLPVRAIHSTASTNSRLSLPLRPGSPGLPRQCGSIFAHWASVKTNRSIQSLNHNQATDENPEFPTDPRQTRVATSLASRRCASSSSGDIDDCSVGSSSNRRSATRATLARVRIGSSS